MLLSPQICPLDFAILRFLIPQILPSSYKEENIHRKHSLKQPQSDVGGWQDFRTLYPEPKRNTGVEVGVRAYQGRIYGKPGEHAKLMDGLRRHLESDDWRRSLHENGGRYIPNMARFIREGTVSRPSAAVQTGGAPV
jgi:hypothetical protein